MEAIQLLGPRQDLRLLAPFKPLPLLSVLARKGFSHVEVPLNDGDWEVLFSRRNVDPLEPSARSEPSAAIDRTGRCADPMVVDARGLEPPQPLIAILEALPGVPVNGSLHALTDRRPVQLYQHLAERGFAGETEERPDGSFITHIRHG